MGRCKRRLKKIVMPACIIINMEESFKTQDSMANFNAQH